MERGQAATATGIGANSRSASVNVDRPHELEDAVKHVRSHGIEVFGPHQFGDAADAYFFYDPDDNLVEFFAYVDAYQPPPLGS